MITTIVGTVAGRSFTDGAAHPQAREALAQLAVELNLREYVSTAGEPIVLPPDASCQLGGDGRLYITGTAALLPREVARVGGDLAVTGPCDRRMRPELLHTAKPSMLALNAFSNEGACAAVVSGCRSLIARDARVSRNNARCRQGPRGGGTCR